MLDIGSSSSSSGSGGGYACGELQPPIEELAALHLVVGDPAFPSAGVMAMRAAIREAASAWGVRGVGFEAVLDDEGGSRDRDYAPISPLLAYYLARLPARPLMAQTAAGGERSGGEGGGALRWTWVRGRSDGLAAGHKLWVRCADVEADT